MYNKFSNNYINAFVHDFFLKEKQKLSIRSLNVLESLLRDNESNFIEKIFKDVGYLKNIRNVGKKTEHELNDFFQRLKNKLIDDSYLDIKKEKSFLIEFEKKPQSSKYKFKTKINFLKKNLSVRSSNVLYKLLKDKDDVGSLLTLMNKNIDIRNLDNAGKKVETELNDFFKKLILEFFNLNNEKDEGNIISAKIGFLFSFEPKPHYTKKGKLSENPFDYFHSIVKNSSLNKNEKQIFDLIFKEKFSGINDISSKMGISKERVRQILTQNFPVKIKNLISIIINEFDLKEIVFPVLEKNSYCYSRNQMVDIINQSMLCNLGLSFFLQFTQSFLNKENYYIIRPDQPLLKATRHNHFRYKTYNSKRNVENFWIIKRDLIKYDKLVNILSEINLKATSKIEKDYILSWNDLKCHFKKQQIEFLSFFMKKEHNVYSNVEGIHFSRTTNIPLWEYIEIAIENLNKWVTISEINEMLIKLFPNKSKKFKSSSIRSTIIREKSIFIYQRNQTSLYGLKAWEDKKNIKGGTIKDLVIEFLNDQGKPCHIKEISKFVLNYRKNSNTHSILSNLQLGTKGRFVFYRGNIIGLSDQYKKETKLEKISINQIIEDIFDYE